MAFKENDRMGEIKTKSSKYPIHRKINRSDIIVTNTNISTEPLTIPDIDTNILLPF